MIDVERCQSSYQLRIPFVMLLNLQGLPEFLNALLADGGGALIARLFPNAYDDHEDEQEYRELMGNTMLEQKREIVSIFEGIINSAAIDLPEASLEIPDDQFDAFLSFINDIRVLVGTDLGIEDGGWELPEDEQHPEMEKYVLLQLMTYLQQQLLSATGLVDNVESFPEQ